jgi:hypothetical protein
MASSAIQKWCVGWGCDLSRPLWIRGRYRAMHVRGSGREGAEGIGNGKATDEVRDGKPEAGAEDAGRQLRRGLHFPESSRPGREIRLAMSPDCLSESKGLHDCLSASNSTSSRLAAARCNFGDSPHGLLDGGLGADAQGGKRGPRVAGFLRGPWLLGRGAAENSAHHVSGATDGAGITSGVRQDGEIPAAGSPAAFHRQSRVLLRYINFG